MVDIEELVALHERVRVAALLERRFTPEHFWKVVGRIAGGAEHLAVEEFGRSALGCPLRALRFGSGDVGVLVWTQMHGDEPTATLTAADLIRYLAEHPDDERVARWRERLSLWIVSILNPDGAARYQRRNAQGIDINRDARARFSPEMRAILDLHERVRPAFAFALHDETADTRVGQTDRMTAISLLAPAIDESLRDNEERQRAKQLCVLFRRAIEPLVGGHVSLYAEEHSPESLGDHLQARGTATVLVETGWWPLDPDLQFLRRVNFVGMVTALDAIATGAYEQVDAEEYAAIPPNDRDVFDLLVRGGRVVLPGVEPFRADLGLDFVESLDMSGGHIAEIGDLSAYGGHEVLIADGLFIHPHPKALATGDDGKPYLELDRPADFTLRRGEDPESEAVWVIRRAVARRADER